MKKNIVLIMIVLLLVSLGFTREKKSPRGEPNKVFEELALSKEQVVQMKDHFEENKKQHVAVRKELVEKHQLLAKELAKNATNQTELNKIIMDIKNIQNQMVDQRVADLMTVKKILTEDQFDKFINREKKMMRKTSKRSEENRRHIISK